MSKVIQLLERLNCPKSVRLQRDSRSSGMCLSRQELYSAMCMDTGGIGVAVVLATELGEIGATEKLQCYLEQSLGYDAKARAMSLVVVSELCNLPVGKKRTKIRSLLKRHGARANRSRKLIDSWTKAIRSLEKTGRHSELVSKHHEDIRRERESLNAFAESYAGRSCHCPRCGGTGEVNTQPCGSCKGLGRFRNTPGDWRFHLERMGVSCLDADLARISELVAQLELAKSEAIAKMGERATAEQVD